MFRLALCFLLCTSVFAEEQTKISDVCKDVKSDLKDFNYDNASNIAAAITSTNKKFDDLCVKIEKAKSYEEVFPEIVKTINEVAGKYEDIAKNKEKISSSLSKQISNVQNASLRCENEINRLNSVVGQTKRKIAVETVDYRKTALQTTLKFQEQELSVWKRFKDDIDFGTLASKMKEAKGGIERFVDILDQNAMVYRAAANTLNAIQDYKNATKDLQEVINVMDLGDQLVNSWSKLSVVIDGAIAHIESVEAKY